MTTPRLVAFDLDDTLAPSKSSLDPRMLETFASLLEVVPVAVISGGNFTQFEQQLVTPLRTRDGLTLDDLHLLPTCGTRYYRWSDDDWALQYAEDLTDDQKARALAAVESVAKDAGYWESETWGDILEDRGSQITFSALGQAAPVDVKKQWDPTGAKKDDLRRRVQAEPSTSRCGPAARPAWTSPARASTRRTACSVSPRSPASRSTTCSSWATGSTPRATTTR